MALELIAQTEPPHDTEAEYLTGIAFLRLEHLIGEAFETYMAAAKAKPDLTVRRHIALELARQHPDVLDAMRGGR
jgi:hypothetical protein